MRRRTSSSTLARSGVALASLLVVAFPATASANARAHQDELHCLLQTDGVDSTGELVVVGETCFAEFPSVLHALGAPPDVVEHVTTPPDLTKSDMSRLSADATPEQAEGSLSASSVIGIHYDGSSATGSSFSVSGSACTGGYLNVSAAWNNRVRSTINGCPAVRHFDGFNVVGTFQDTVGYGGNLTYMDRRTSSIQYR